MDVETTYRKLDVLIIGAGPAGLAAAVKLKQRGVAQVLVAEREAVAGGVPRHCNHTGFGLLDLHFPHSGPSYARKWVERAKAAQVEIVTKTTALKWMGDRSLLLSGPGNLTQAQASAVILATGCRERPRSARLVPGSRSQNIWTTGMLQQWVYLNKKPLPFKRPLIVGAEHVSFSAVATCKDGGARPVGLVTEAETHQTYFWFKLLMTWFGIIPVHRNARVLEILGQGDVTGVKLGSIDGKVTQAIECDAVVFTGDWIPENEIARLGGIDLNAGTRGPAITSRFQTSVPGVFSVGNLNHGAERADIASLEGSAAALAVIDFLAHQTWDQGSDVQVVAPIHWVTPNRLGQTKQEKFTLRVDRVLKNGFVQALQNGRVIASRSFREMVPNHWYQIKVSGIDPSVSLTMQWKS